jgi:ketosteroid isomerase-like protein
MSNRDVAMELFARFTAGDVPGVLALMHDDATWKIPGKPELSPSAGVYSKDKIGALFDTMMGRLKGGLRMTVKNVIAEGAQAAVEVTSHGELKNGRIYEQEYHFLLEFRDGRIAAVREYLDTQHAFAVWLQR